VSTIVEAAAEHVQPLARRSSARFRPIHCINLITLTSPFYNNTTCIVLYYKTRQWKHKQINLKHTE